MSSSSPNMPQTPSFTSEAPWTPLLMAALCGHLPSPQSDPFRGSLTQLLLWPSGCGTQPPQNLHFVADPPPHHRSPTPGLVAFPFLRSSVSVPLSRICFGRPGWKLISSHKVTPAWLDHPEKPRRSKSDTDGACDLARAGFLREAQGPCLASSASSRVSREFLCSRQVLIMSTTKRRGEGDRAPAAGREEWRERGGHPSAGPVGPKYTCVGPR